MIDRRQTTAFVRSRGHNIRSRMGKLYASTLDSKIARTFTDDLDVDRGSARIRGARIRPGQRDDDVSCVSSRLLTI